MSNEELANKLLKLKKDKKEADEEMIRFKAKLDTALEGLGMSFEEAEKKLKEFKNKISVLETEIEEKAEALEEKYEI